MFAIRPNMTRPGRGDANVVSIDRPGFFRRRSVLHLPMSCEHGSQDRKKRCSTTGRPCEPTQNASAVENTKDARKLRKVRILKLAPRLMLGATPATEHLVVCRKLSRSTIGDAGAPLGRPQPPIRHPAAKVVGGSIQLGTLPLTYTFIEWCGIFTSALSGGIGPSTSG